MLKTEKAFQWALTSHVNVENRLRELEAFALSKPEDFQDNILSFVPDTLAFDCAEGVWIIRTDVLPLQSFVAVRVP